MISSIPLSAPDIGDDEIDAVVSVLRTSSLSLGPKLEEFEQALAAFHNIPYSIAVSSGTAALHLAIRALDIGEGDEVIVPSFTFIAVANAVRYERGIPVFCDIDPITLNLDPVSVEAAINPRTRAIIVVHTFGIPAAMNLLVDLAQRHNLRLIEDCCEAIGSTYFDRPVGTFGDISVFGFYPNKQITTGEGGAVLTRDSRVATRIRAMRNQGRYPTGDWLQHSELGFNYRLPEMACALGIIQLNRLPSILARRANVARSYDDLLSPIHNLERPPLELSSVTISWFVYVVRLQTGCRPEARDLIMNDLRSKGIASARYFAPIHLQPAYISFEAARRLPLDVTESIARRTIALPFFNCLSFDQLEYVTQALASSIKSLV